MSIARAFHLEPDGEGFKLFVGRFRDRALAEHFVETMQEFANDGLNLLELASIPACVLKAVIEAERDLQKGSTYADIKINAGPDGARRVDYQPPPRTFRSTGRKQRKS